MIKEYIKKNKVISPKKKKYQEIEELLGLI